MSVQTTHTLGKFVWHELMTTDVDAALKFYGGLFGWKFKTGEMGPMKYHEIMVGERPIGGITGVMNPGQPSAWGAYVTVDSVDDAVERARRTGGKVVVPPMDIPHTGRFATLADPAGAVIAPFTYDGEQAKPEQEGAPAPGTFCWNELLTADPAGAQRFYGELFGWTSGEWNMGEQGTYHLFRCAGKDVAGMMKTPPQAPRSHWLYYVAATDVDASLKKAESMGAKTQAAPMDIPEVGRMAVFADPSGALIALFKGSAR